MATLQAGRRQEATTEPSAAETLGPSSTMRM